VGARSKSRKRAVDVLFEADQRGRPLAEVLEWRRTDSGAATPLPDYTIEIVEGVASRQSALDETIATASEGWVLDRMPAVDRAILRVGAWEILYSSDVETPVAIDEAVSLATALSTDDSPAFVNGVLGTIARTGVRDPENGGALPDPPVGEVP
jgi:N utilization substance protein B